MVLVDKNDKIKTMTSKEKIAQLIAGAINELQQEGRMAKFDIPPVIVQRNDVFGYACNIAFQIKAQAGNPVETAKDIVTKINTNEFLVQAVNGFINFGLSNQLFLDCLNDILSQKDKYGSANIGKGRTMVIDYSSPNIAKSFGIGHLRSTIIGQAIYNLYKFLGWKCIGDNHLGDWGTQFGKLIYQIQKDQVDLKTLDIAKLEELYVKFHQNAQENPSIEEDARQWFKELEQGNKEALKIWEVCKKISLQEFDRIYSLLGVKIDNAIGESQYNKGAKEVIDLLVKKGIAQSSQGALIVEYPEEKLPPVVLKKSDGTTTYFARDLAAIVYRDKKFKPDLIIYETGVDQVLYFKQTVRAAKDLDLKKEIQFAHIGHGLIRTQEGKFSTRKGQTVHLQDVLDEAIAKAGDIMSKVQQTKELNQKEKEELSKIVGIGAIKYNDLSRDPKQDIVFSWENILNLHGNSGPYIQYVYARCQSILEKAKAKNVGKTEFSSFNQAEIEVLKLLEQFPMILEEAHNNFSASIICNYIFSLCQKFNYFYETCPIIAGENKDQKNFRLALVKAVAQVIKNSLNLLGISAPAKM